MLVTASLFCGSALVAGQLHAGGGLQSVSHPTNYCQSALPVFDGNIRKRPQAVQNEGTGPAFVTCSYPSGEGRVAGPDGTTTMVWQYLINNSDAAVTINCTGVAGYPGDGPEQFIVKSAVVDPGAIGEAHIWEAADFDGAPAAFPEQGVFSISCNLPPGAGLAQSYVNSSAAP